MLAAMQVSGTSGRAGVGLLGLAREEKGAGWAEAGVAGPQGWGKGREGPAGKGFWVGFGFSSFFLLSYFLSFSISNTNQTKTI